MILHIPHSSIIIPEDLRNQIVLSNNDLSAELNLMTDRFTDELFALPDATMLRFPISRLLVDVERFPDDENEPMSKVGMGMIYTHTASGRNLKRLLKPQERKSLVSLYYEAHRQALFNEVNSELAKYGIALIVDCHSFPSQPLPCDKDQSMPRPDFCIGTHPVHTPEALAQMTAMNLEKMGYNVRMNQPYEGTLIPIEFYEKDRRVVLIMVEVNRRLYMDETTGTKTGAFDFIKNQIQGLLHSIKEFQQRNQLD